jgi:hypothetical protein
MVTFSAACENDQVLIEWTTASETNNDYFTVERSTNNFEFENMLGMVGKYQYYYYITMYRPS